MHQYKQIILVVCLLSIVMAIWMRGWINGGVPLTPREENLSQLTDLSNYVKSASLGLLWSPWNQLENTGAPSMIQRSYIIFAPLAQIANTFRISSELIYKLSMLAGFIFSAIGMYLLLLTIGTSKMPAFIAGLSYMLSPPHITLASDLLDFNFYWALIPWIVFTVEKFLKEGSPLFYGSLAGLLLTLASFAGNTYFVTATPFFIAYLLLRIYLTRQSHKINFFAYTIGFFFTLSAFITIPSSIEFPHTWLSQEIQRKQIIDLPQLSQLLKLFSLRWKNHSPLDWSMDFRYPDMSWYFGTAVVVLAASSISSYKKFSSHLLPIGAILLCLIPVFFIMQNSAIKYVALKIIQLFPQIQSTFDRTYRLFILPSFFLSLLAGLGSQLILKSRSGITGIIIILAILIDFFPLSAYFFTTTHQELSLPQKTVTTINSTPGRYWLAFPYVAHLPKYKYEYVSRQITLPRVNSEYSYSALAPLYSSQLFEHNLFGALERKILTPEQVDQILFTANTNIIILPQASHDYTHDVAWFTKNGWETLDKTTSYWVLKRTHPIFDNYSNPPLPEEINLSLNIPTQTKLTISESWYPGWQVTIDNRHVPLLRSGHAFLGTKVPAGQHLVKFTYTTPWYYFASKIVSVIALALFVMARSARFVTSPLRSGL